MSDSITIITTKSSHIITTEDRGGGQEHGIIPNLVNSVVEKIDADHFFDQVEAIAGKVRNITERLKGRVGEFEADEITISLAVSGDGSVGIATVGAEASIEIKFKRNKPEV